MKKSKFLKTLTIFGAAACAPLLLTGCGTTENKTDFRVYNGYIQTTTDGTNWENLISLEDIKGEDGIDGIQYTIGADGYWYLNGVKTSKKAVGTDGEDGNGIKSITKDTTNSTSEKTIYIIELEDGTKSTFEVINGEDATISTYTITYDYTVDEMDLSTILNISPKSQTVNSNEWIVNMPSIRAEYAEYFEGWCVEGTNKIIESYDFIGGNVVLKLKPKQKFYDALNKVGDMSFSENVCTITSNENEIIVVPALYYSSGKLFKVTKLDAIGVHDDGTRKWINVTIPETIQYIESGVFINASNIETFNFLGTLSQWCEVGFYMGQWYENIPMYHTKKLLIQGKEVKGEVIIPEGTTKINRYAFVCCEGITSITLPNTLTEIGSSAFYGCTGLTNVILPDNVTKIGDSCFAYCSNLQSVKLSNNIETLDEFTFSDCSKLTSIHILSNIYTIGLYNNYSTFYHCTNLSTVIIDSATIANSLISTEDGNCYLIGYAETVYIKTGLSTINSTYLLENFTKQETSDKTGYDMWVKK